MKADVGCEKCGSKIFVVTMGMLTEGLLIDDNLILQENEPFGYDVSVKCQKCGQPYSAKDFGFRVKKDKVVKEKGTLYN
jgi:DNA-directed RNA polymerase subunit RPC12/RpoP